MIFFYYYSSDFFISYILNIFINPVDRYYHNVYPAIVLKIHTQLLNLIRMQLYRFKYILPLSIFESISIFRKWKPHFSRRPVPTCYKTVENCTSIIDAFHQAVYTYLQIDAKKPGSCWLHGNKDFSCRSLGFRRQGTKTSETNGRKTGIVRRFSNLFSGGSVVVLSEKQSKT